MEASFPTSVTSEASELSSPEHAREEEIPRSTVVEEEILRDVIQGFVLERENAAYLEVLLNATGDERDDAFSSFLTEEQQRSSNSASELRHLLASRAKIAFNMCTVNEVDPSVETKLADDRVREE